MSRDGDAIVVRIPVRFHRRNGRQMVLTHGNNNGDDERESNGTLVAALAKAHRWQEQLESGEYASLEHLAAANGVTPHVACPRDRGADSRRGRDGGDKPSPIAERRACGVGGTGVVLK